MQDWFIFTLQNSTKRIHNLIPMNFGFRKEITQFWIQSGNVVSSHITAASSLISTCSRPSGFILATSSDKCILNVADKRTSGNIYASFNHTFESCTPVVDVSSLLASRHKDVALLNETPIQISRSSSCQYFLLATPSLLQKSEVAEAF